MYPVIAIGYFLFLTRKKSKLAVACDVSRVGQNYTFIGMYGVHTEFGQGNLTKLTVIYGAVTRFWPILNIWQMVRYL
jgi:hypothetical protein